MLAWSRRCWTSFGCVPRESNRVAHVCLRSCQRISGKSARRSKGLKYLFTMFYAYSVYEYRGATRCLLSALHEAPRRPDSSAEQLIVTSQSERQDRSCYALLLLLASMLISGQNENRENPYVAPYIESSGWDNTRSFFLLRSPHRRWRRTVRETGGC